MRNILVNDYILKDPKIHKDTIIVNISDIHSNIEALKQIVKVLQNIKSDYILMPGDVIDSSDDYRNEIMINYLKQISDISDTFLSLGNHEMIRSENHIKYIPFDEYSAFFEELYSNSKCVSFINGFESIDLDDNITLSAINVPSSYYESKEQKEIAKKFLESLEPNLNSERFNILLSHSPNWIISDNKIDISDNFINSMNLILCGHNHGGLMPTCLQDVFKNHYGFVDPYARLFRSNSYGVYNEKDTSVLISNGVTKISETSVAPKLKIIFDSIYKPEIDLIHMKTGDKHSLSLIKRKVHNIYK